MTLLAAHPAPPGWLPGWSPGGPVRRCGTCGAHLVAECSRYTRCERGCVRLPARPPRGKLGDAPPPVSRSPAPELARLRAEAERKRSEAQRGVPKVEAKERAGSHDPARSRDRGGSKTAAAVAKKAGPPPPPPDERERFTHLLGGLRVLEAGYVRTTRQGRPPSAASVELGLKALALFHESCPNHGAAIAAALPWLTRKAGQVGAA